MADGPLLIDPKIAMTIADLVSLEAGQPCDVVVIVNREGHVCDPCFLASVPPEVFESMMLMYAERIKEFQRTNTAPSVYRDRPTKPH